MASDTLGNLTVKLSIAMADFERGMARASEKLEDFSAKAMGLGKAAGAGAATMGGAIAVAVKKFADAEETIDLVRATFGPLAKETNAWAKEFANKTNRSSTELLGMAGGMQSMLAPMLGSQEAAAGLSMRLAEAAVDLGSLFNQDQTQVLQRLRSAMTGSVEAVDQFGINLHESAMKSMALQMGIKGNVASLDEATKAQIRYNIILRDSAQAQGNAADTAGSITNQMRGLRAATDDLLISIGSAFAPFIRETMAKTLAALRSVQETIDNLSEDTRNKLAGAFFKTAGALSAVSAAAVGAAGLAKLGAIMTSIAKAARPVMLSFAKLTFIIFGIVAGVGALSMAWNSMSDQFTDLPGETTVAIKAATDTVKEYFTDLVAIMDKTFATMAAGVGNAVALISGEISLGEFFRRIKAEASDFGSTVVDRFAEIQNDSEEQFKKVGDNAKEFIFDPLKASLKEGMRLFQALGKEASKALADAVGIDLVAELERTLDAVNAAAPTAMSGSLSTGTKFGGHGVRGSGPDPMTAIREQLARVDRVDPSRFTAGQQAMLGLDSAIGTLSGKLGKAGDVMNSFAQGFSSGGIIGGVINAFASLLMETEFFKEIIDASNRALGRVIGILDRVLEKFKPIINIIEKLDAAALDLVMQIVEIIQVITPFGVVIDLITKLLDGLVYVTQFFSNVLKAVVEHLKKIGDLFMKGTGLGAAFGKLKEWGGSVTDGIKDFFGFKKAVKETTVIVGELAIAMEKFSTTMGFDSFASGRHTADLINMVDGTLNRRGTTTSGPTAIALTPEQVASVKSELEKRAKLLEDEAFLNKVAGNFEQAAYLEAQAEQIRLALKGLEESTSDAADSMKEISEELTNVPSGIKLSLERFRAIQRDGMLAGGASSSNGATTVADAANGGNVTNVDQVVIVSADAAKTMEEISRRVRHTNLATSGSKDTSGQAGNMRIR